MHAVVRNLGCARVDAQTRAIILFPRPGPHPHVLAFFLSTGVELGDCKSADYLLQLAIRIVGISVTGNFVEVIWRGPASLRLTGAFGCLAWFFKKKQV